MYWIISILWSVLGTIAFCSFLTYRWNKIDPFWQQMLDTFRILHPIPGPGYLDLKFSIIRHALFFLASSFIIFYVKIRFILNSILFLNVLYCWMPITRYKFRKKDVAEASARPSGQSTASAISVPIKDSFCTVVHAVGCVIILYILYAIRP